MVFFTCNHCGESLKKPAVEKHYQWKSCKGAPPFLTCVDCLKDFRGEEFKAHTKCISENEKYSAKGFVAKPERNKGAQKQEAWTEIIQNHLVQRTDLDNYTRQTLEKIATQTNVPRKQAKFINFIKNSLRISPNSALKIWSVVERALDDFKAKTDADKAEQAAKRKLEEDEREAAKSADGEPPKKKSKKDKKRKAEDVPEESGEDNVDTPKKKKMKSKQIDKVTSTTEDSVPIENGNSKSEKKKNKKLKSTEITEDITTTTSVATANGTKKSKKNKKKHQVTNGTAEPRANGTLVPIGFEWKKIITSILSKKPQMKLGKLQDKVLKKYAASSDGVAVTQKDEKKFHKHLQKLSKFVEVNGDSVKLISAQKLKIDE